jgi:hypothetical protein
VIVRETTYNDHRRFTLEVYQLPGEDAETFGRRVIQAIEEHNFNQTGDTQAPLQTRG